MTAPSAIEEIMRHLSDLNEKFTSLNNDFREMRKQVDVQTQPQKPLPALK